MPLKSTSEFLNYYVLFLLLLAVATIVSLKAQELMKNDGPDFAKKGNSTP